MGYFSVIVGDKTFKHGQMSEQAPAGVRKADWNLNAASERKHNSRRAE